MSKLLIEELGDETYKHLEKFLDEDLLPEVLDNALEKKLSKIRKKFECRLLDIVEGKVTEDVMEVLLSLMSLVFLLDKNYRKNISDFEAVYVFTDQKDDFYMAARFHKGRLKVSNKKAVNPSFTLRFRDNDTLIKMFLSGKAADILESVLEQKVDFQGNISYICKFGYMALHILLELTGQQKFADE